MEEFDYDAYVKMVKEYQQKDDPLGWFDSIYKNAQGDYKNVFWADLEPNPYLIQWLSEEHITKKDKTACVIGCGVGDDAEALSDFGYEVTAFDISQSAIDLCKKRYPNSKVDYVVVDLFNCPKTWEKSFDVIYECNTIQVLPGDYRKQARAAIANLVNKGGYVLVSCRSRKEGEQEDDIPFPLSKSEMDEFIHVDGLNELFFFAYNDTQEPPVPHFWAAYQSN